MTTNTDASSSSHATVQSITMTTSISASILPTETNVGKGGLTEGDKTGIGVSVGACAVVLIVVAAAFLVSGRRRNEHVEHTNELPPSTGEYDDRDLIGGRKGLYEVDENKGPYEADGWSRTPELQG